MKSALMEVVEGWTGALPFTLKADGVAVNLTGMTVAIVLKDVTRRIVNQSSSGVTVTGSTSGQVEYLPSTSGDFYVALTPYLVRFQVSDALGRTVYFPNRDEDLIVVNER